MGAINSNERIAATLYSLGTLFGLRNICINTLHKGDNDDDDDNNNNGHIGHCTYLQIDKVKVK
jgi:hypothetical protein